MKRKELLRMFFTLNRAAVIGFAAVVTALLMVACSNDKPVDLTSPNDNQIINKKPGTTESGTPPSEGTVVEGVSVPGIALGFTRADVLDAYGEPQWCQSSGSPGNQAYCSFPVDGGGQVDVNFRGADGGNANGTSDDVVFKISWTEAVSGWVTTAGINTTIAKENPNDVVIAYPDAQVNYTQFGTIHSVIDYLQGIEIIWVPDYLSGKTHIRMAIFYSTDPPPIPDKFTHVSSINLTSRKVRGKRQVEGFVKVQDEQNQSVRGATVIAHWTFPNGNTQVVEDATSGTGNAHFEINDVPRGIYSLTVDDVVKEGYEFDSNNSVLSKSIKVK